MKKAIFKNRNSTSWYKEAACPKDGYFLLGQNKKIAKCPLCEELFLTGRFINKIVKPIVYGPTVKAFNEKGERIDNNTHL